MKIKVNPTSLENAKTILVRRNHQLTFYIVYTELLPPEVDSGPTLATDLQPPPLPEQKLRKDVPATLFVINVFAVKNKTAEDSNDVLQDDVIGEVSDQTIGIIMHFPDDV